MSVAGGKSSRDLALVSAASLASLALMPLPVDGLLKALALMPLVLFLPGYAVTAAMFLPGTLSRSERFVYAVTASFGAAVLGGLLWQLVLRLDRFAWASVLTAITLVACLVSQRRRARARGQARDLPGLARLDAPTALAALGAVALAVVAIGTAIDGLQKQRAESHFSALWVVPRATSAGAVEIGIWNHQGAIHDYRLSVTGDGRTIRRWEGRLGSRKRMRLILRAATIPSGAPLVVSLYRDGAFYRRAELQAGTEA